MFKSCIPECKSHKQLTKDPNVWKGMMWLADSMFAILCSFTNSCNVETLLCMWDNFLEVRRHHKIDLSPESLFFEGSKRLRIWCGNTLGLRSSDSTSVISQRRQASFYSKKRNIKHRDDQITPFKSDMWATVWPMLAWCWGNDWEFVLIFGHIMILTESRGHYKLVESDCYRTFPLLLHSRSWTMKVLELHMEGKLCCPKICLTDILVL